VPVSSASSVPWSSARWSQLEQQWDCPRSLPWDRCYALDPTNNVPPATLELLRHDPDVAAFSGFDYNNVEIDGQTVPVLFARSLGEIVTPPILSGHDLHANDQIVVGAATLAVLHKRVGDTVFELRDPGRTPLCTSRQHAW